MSQTILIGNLSFKFDAKCSRKIKTFSTSAKNSINKCAIFKYTVLLFSSQSLFGLCSGNIPSRSDSLSQFSLYSFIAKVCHHGKFDRYAEWCQLPNDFSLSLLF